MVLKAIDQHIQKHPVTMGIALTLPVLTALAGLALVGLSFSGPFRASMQTWMSHKVLGHARWNWLVGGAIASTTFALGALGLSFVLKDKKAATPPQQGEIRSNIKSLAESAIHDLSSQPPAGPVPVPTTADEADLLAYVAPVPVVPVPVMAPPANGALPPGWEAFDDEATGLRVYLNTSTGHTQWELPTT